MAHRPLASAHDARTHGFCGKKAREDVRRRARRDLNLVHALIERGNRCIQLGLHASGGHSVSDQLFATFAMEPFEKVEGVPQSGLVGYEIFKRFVVTIDYQGKQLTLTDPAAFQYQGKGTVVPFKFVGRDPQVDGQVDGVAGAFLIDTGSRASLDLMGPFVAKHGMADKYPSKVEGVTGWGVGGPARSRVIRIASLRLGGVEIKSPVAELSLQKKGSF